MKAKSIDLPWAKPDQRYKLKKKTKQEVVATVNKAARPDKFDILSNQGISSPEEKRNLAKCETYQRFNRRSKQLGFE